MQRAFQRDDAQWRAEVWVGRGDVLYVCSALLISSGRLSHTAAPCPCCRCTVAAEGPHSFRHNCSLPVVQTDRSPMRGARSEEPGEGPWGLGG